MGSSGGGNRFFVAVLTFQIVSKTDHGQKYILFLNRSPVWTLITMAIFVGPAEDIFFLGIIQNTLSLKIGWGAILVYMIIFTLFHCLNTITYLAMRMGVTKRRHLELKS